MFLKDLVVHVTTHYSKENEVTMEAMHLCDLFLKLLGKYKTPVTKKIVIVLIEKDVESLNGFKIYKHIPYKPYDIIEYYCDFSFDDYFQMSDDKKKKLIWELLYKSVLHIGKELNWDTRVVKLAYLKGLELNLTNHSFLCQQKKSPDKKYLIDVEAHFDIDRIVVDYKLFDVNGVVVKNGEVLNLGASWGYYHLPYATFKWDDDNSFSLVNSREKEIIKTIEL